MGKESASSRPNRPSDVSAEVWDAVFSAVYNEVDESVRVTYDTVLKKRGFFEAMKSLDGSLPGLMDSLDFVEVIMHIEDDLEIEISDSEAQSVSGKTILQLAKLAQKKVNEKTGSAAA